MILELLVNRDDCLVLQDTHPTDRHHDPHCQLAHLCVKEGSFNLPLRVWTAGHNVYQNFVAGMEGWLLLDRDSLLRNILPLDAFVDSYGDDYGYSLFE